MASARKHHYQQQQQPQPQQQMQSLMDFEDLLPTMAEKLGSEGLMQELCNGFNLLMDPSKGLITLDSLRRNAGFLGLENLTEDELKSMMDEGDLDGDGALNQMEFCVLMFRLSPELMEESWRCADDAIMPVFFQ